MCSSKLQLCKYCIVTLHCDKSTVSAKYHRIVLLGVYCPPMSIHTWGITSSSATSHSWRDCSP